MSKTIKRFFFIFALFLSIISVNVYSQQSDMVVFNTKTLKYHELGCSSANRCTKNCIVISRNEAIKKGGVHCKNCIRAAPQKKSHAQNKNTNN